MANEDTVMPAEYSDATGRQVRQVDNLQTVVNPPVDVRTGPPTLSSEVS
jgi:hypothetical protein